MNTHYFREEMNMLKTNRSLLGYILLNIVTLGIYSLFFFHGIARDMNIACQGDGKKTGGLLAFIFLSAITCGIYSFVWYYKLGERIADNSRRRGVACNVDGGNTLLWMILGSMLCGLGPLIALHKLIDGMNDLFAAYNANPNGMPAYAAAPMPVVNVNINK